MKNTLVLDLDGTLADTVHDLISVLNRVTASSGLAPVTVAEVGHVVGGGARAMIARAFKLRNAPLDPRAHERLLQAFIEDYERNIAVDTVLFEGVGDVLEHYGRLQWRLAVCTNKREYLAIRLLRELGVADRFHAVTGGDTFEFCKPDPRHLTATVERAGGDPHRSVMVGDSITDIETARRAGIPVVAVTFGYSEAPVAEYGPDRLISHFRELPAAVSSLLPQ